MIDLKSLTLESAQTAVQQREITATALAEAFYTQIESGDKDVHAFLTLSKERALAQAHRMDHIADRGYPLPPLGGVPIAIKDVMNTRDVRTTAGSRILENYIPPYDATAVARLEAMSSPEIEDLSLRLLDATNLDELFS